MCHTNLGKEEWDVDDPICGLCTPENASPSVHCASPFALLIDVIGHGKFAFTKLSEAALAGQFILLPIHALQSSGIVAIDVGRNHPLTMLLAGANRVLYEILPLRV